MGFDKNANLFPCKVIETGLEIFEQVFVLDFPFSTTRKRIFENYLIYLENLKNTVESPFCQWIDGSFVSNKTNPKDIDFVTFLDFEIYRKNEKEISKLLNLCFNKLNFTDDYFVEVFPEGHKNFNNFQMDKIEWLHTFGTSRVFENKGIIQLNF
ncbi:MAG: hypothetical protein U5N85_20230 [Arcicella sp.]|nr:hypothetical protein [Arcicella sp.]